MNAAPQSLQVTLVRSGSWSCENAEAGSLTGLDCSATKLCEACAQYFSDFACNATDAALSHREREARARQAKVRAHHALTAAIIGLTPKIFSTRVKL
jgi:hypothetical protein